MMICPRTSVTLVGPCSVVGKYAEVVTGSVVIEVVVVGVVVVVGLGLVILFPFPII